jgi:hypothetical protein
VVEVPLPVSYFSKVSVLAQLPPETLSWPAGKAAVLIQEKSAFQANPRSAD